MKICKYCGAKSENSNARCVSCAGVDFKYICANCDNVFESGFCPNCGVKAGNEGRKCPDCGMLFFSRCCPNCGYDSAPRSNDDGEGYDFPDGTYDTSPIERSGALRGVLSAMLPFASWGRTIRNKLVFFICLVFGIWALICGCWLLSKGTTVWLLTGSVLIVAACVALIVGFRKRKGR